MLQDVIIKSIMAILASFIICISLGPWFIRFMITMNMKQYIRKEGPKAHYIKAGTPTMGGLLILTPMIFSVIVFVSLKNTLIWLVLLTTIGFAIIGFIDDYIMQINKHNKGLGVKQKLIIQVFIATITSYLILILPEYDTKLIIPFFDYSFIEMSYWRVPFSILVIVGTSNAVNLSDGLDGLAISTIITSKIAYMVVIFILIVSIPYDGQNTKDISDLAIYCGAVVGSGLGFLWFNSYPAEIFMGDSGSLSMGASLGTIAILVKHELLLLLVAAIFVVETLSVILQVCFFKISNGQRLFKMAPLHHHFELSGVSEPKIVLRFFLLSFVLLIFSIFIVILRYT